MPKRPDSALDLPQKDLATNLQLATEEVVLHLARNAPVRCGMMNPSLADGVAFNDIADDRNLLLGSLIVLAGTLAAPLVDALS